MDAPLTQTRFRVEGMDCASCAAKIETATRRAPGIEEVSVSVTAGTMTVQHGPDGDLALVVKKVTSLGYKIAPLAATGPAPVANVPVCGHDHHHDRAHGHS